jgi:hypothetical protein
VFREDTAYFFLTGAGPSRFGGPSLLYSKLFGFETLSELPPQPKLIPNEHSKATNTIRRNI